MHSQFNLWKATIAVVIYVAVCMLILCFSPPDEAATLGAKPLAQIAATVFAAP